MEGTEGIVLKRDRFMHGRLRCMGKARACLKVCHTRKGEEWKVGWMQGFVAQREMG